MKRTLLLFLLCYHLIYAQDVKIPDYYKMDAELSNPLHKIVSDLGLDRDFDVGEDRIERISLAVIDLTKDGTHLGGVNFANFIYPASGY